MALTDYFSPAISFSTVSDITKSTFLDPSLSSSVLSQNLTGAYITAPAYLYYYIYSDYFINTLYYGSSTDAFNAGQYVSALASLRSNTYSTVRSLNTSLLAALPTIYQTSVCNTTKYDTLMSTMTSLKTSLSTLKSQCSTITTNMTATKNGLPSNQPNSSIYSNVITCYTNLINGVTQLSNFLDSSMTLLQNINTYLSSMQGCAQTYMDGIIADNDYNISQRSSCHSIVQYVNTLNSYLLYMAQVNPAAN